MFSVLFFLFYFFSRTMLVEIIPMCMQWHVTTEMVVPAAIRLCVSVCVKADGLTTHTAPLKHQFLRRCQSTSCAHTDAFLFVRFGEWRQTHRFFFFLFLSIRTRIPLNPCLVLYLCLLPCLVVAFNSAPLAELLSCFCLSVATNCCWVKQRQAEKVGDKNA